MFKIISLISGYKKITNLILLFTGLLFSYKATAQQSDNGDGTYTNPIIWADFPDNDVIRVHDTYYMVCTTMYFFPGVPIMKSKDLVNWEYATNAISEFKQHPAYDMDGGTRYGHGQWATSIRYHNGKFYLLFVTLDEGGFLCTADRAEGPWKVQKLPKAYYDAGLFFDDDGRNYIVHGYSKLSLTEVDGNLAPITKDSVIVSKVLRPGLEGSHVYKINGYYYIYATYGGGDGFQVCLRSKNIYGPYEEKIVLRDDMNVAGRGVHQGALVQTQKGEWWSIVFQDRGGVGRVPTLQPVHWIDDWPIVGKNGRAVVTYKKPDVGKNWPATVLPTNDEFSSGTLGMQWSWNHNPDNLHWSLNERKGYLRLKTAKVANGLVNARNTLTQRIFGPASTAVTELDVTHMKAGDMAGLGVLQIPHGFIAVQTGEKEKSIVMIDSGRLVTSVPLKVANKLFFKCEVSTLRDEAKFSYSLDNVQFVQLGSTVHLKFSLKMFTGNRFALFNYATKDTGGYVDFNWFRMKTRQGAPNRFFAGSRIRAAFYDEINLARAASSRDSAGANDNDITHLINGASLSFNSIDFGTGYHYMALRAAATESGLQLKVYIDNDLSTPAAIVPIEATGGKYQYQTMYIPFKQLKGKHKLTFKFEGGMNDTANINWFSFTNEIKK